MSSAQQRGITPLTINTKSYPDSKAGVVAAATFRYDETSSTTPRRRSSVTQRPGSRQQQQARNVVSPRRQRAQQQQTPTMNAYPNNTSAVPQAMFVRALYDYEADDRTSLSFRQGDIIQVITQLESGWWDGIHSGIRGWFPSNYCAVIASPEDGQVDHGAQSTDEGESGTEEEDFEDSRALYHAATSQTSTRAGSRSHDAESQEEEAAFWIPQATPDGRLFYYNTLTGVSTMELPLQTPTSLNETGPRDRMNVNAPEQTRPPPEMRLGGYETREEDEASEVEDSVNRARNAPLRKRRSYVSDGVSPAASMESLDNSPVSRPRADTRDFYRSAQAVAGGMPLPGVTVPSFTGNLLSQYAAASVPRSFCDDGSVPPLTWNRLVENMRKSVESYRQAISNCDRAEFVRKAEDISDHLRMLLAAGSGTTDNHSGNPSVISTNKALYPHFRDMMSRFSKLVLSSHIAAADWPAPDSYSKCLQEAEGVLHGVYGYVEIARAQRGEEIPRLVPGFVLGSNSGGNWQSNSTGATREPITSTSFMDQDDYDAVNEPSTNLDVKLLERMDEQKRLIVMGLKRLDEQLVVAEKVVSPARHEQLSNSICTAAIKVIESLRPCISLLESINLGSLGGSAVGQLADFATHKQRMYDLTGAVVVACQTVGGPLGDEWADVRGEPLAPRMQEIRNLSKQLESSITQMTFCIQGLVSSKQAEKPPPSRDTMRRNDFDTDYSSRHMRNASSGKIRHHHGESGSFDGGVEPSTNTFREKPKLSQFFGVSLQDEIPEYLHLDYESEIAWDKKTEPPQLKGGTLAALVEQLTRHDRLETNFNNTFLLTYRSFTTASELFEMLVRRFTIQPPRGISQDNYRVWVDKKQRPIRFRVVNILKSWFDSYWMEGKTEASTELLRRVYSFAKDSVATSNTPGTGPLISVIEQRLKGHDPTPKRMVPNMNGQAPAPIVPKNMKKLKFLDIDPTEFARQLTVIEYSLYGKIKPTECLGKTWQKKITPEEDDPAPNVKALILHSNQLTNWVAEMILAQSDVKRRALVIKHFVSVADKCRQLNNFSTLTSIISALSTAPIHRLNRTWNQVNARTSTTLETMRRLMGSTKNFGEYRETLHSANPPCIPFFGVYLTDLTFIEDGIPSIIKKTDLINFAKRTKTAEVIRDIQQYQNVPYPLTAVKELQEYILNNMQAAGDVHEMYDRSLAVEPREREDEKIARLLSESGFL